VGRQIFERTPSSIPSSASNASNASKTTSKKRKRSHLLDGLDMDNIIGADQKRDKKMEVKEELTTRVTRKKENAGDELKYDQGYHPLDEVLRPERAKKRRAKIEGKSGDDHDVDEEEVVTTETITKETFTKEVVTKEITKKTVTTKAAAIEAEVNKAAAKSAKMFDLSDDEEEEEEEDESSEATLTASDVTLTETVIDLTASDDEASERFKIEECDKCRELAKYGKVKKCIHKKVEEPEKAKEHGDHDRSKHKEEPKKSEKHDKLQEFEDDNLSEHNTPKVLAALEKAQGLREHGSEEPELQTADSDSDWETYNSDDDKKPQVSKPIYPYKDVKWPWMESLQGVDEMIAQAEEHADYRVGSNGMACLDIYFLSNSLLEIHNDNS
jgi:hypothetical protein